MLLDSMIESYAI